MPRQRYTSSTSGSSSEPPAHQGLTADFPPGRDLGRDVFLAGVPGRGSCHRLSEVSAVGAGRRSCGRFGREPPGGRVFSVLRSPAPCCVSTSRATPDPPPMRRRNPGRPGLQLPVAGTDHQLSGSIRGLRAGSCDRRTWNMAGASSQSGPRRSAGSRFGRRPRAGCRRGRRPDRWVRTVRPHGAPCARARGRGSGRSGCPSR